MSDHEIPPPSAGMPKSISHDGTSSWASRLAILQMAFYGMILIGFIFWMLTSIRFVMENDPYPSHWLVPIRDAISQPIGSVIGITGGYLLLKRQRLGLYVSIAAIPIILSNYRLSVGFLSTIDWIIIPPFYDGSFAKDQVDLIISVWIAIYASCVTAIAGLLVICWKMVRK